MRVVVAGEAGLLNAAVSWCEGGPGQSTVIANEFARFRPDKVIFLDLWGGRIELNGLSRVSSEEFEERIRRLGSEFGGRAYFYDPQNPSLM